MAKMTSTPRGPIEARVEICRSTLRAWLGRVARRKLPPAGAAKMSEESCPCARVSVATLGNSSERFVAGGKQASCEAQIQIRDQQPRFAVGLIFE
jgi:hypothetical protein